MRATALVESGETRDTDAATPRWVTKVCLAPVLAGGLLLAACTSAPNDSSGGNGDPLEPVNRVVFAVNDMLDQIVLRPVAFVYKEAVPDPVRDVVRNFLRWLNSPVVLANDLMQGDFDHAKVTSARFLVNGAMLGHDRGGRGTRAALSQ